MDTATHRKWTADHVLELARSYQPAAVLAAAAQLGIFDVLADGPRNAADLARTLSADPRGTAILLDALAALGLLEKLSDAYALAPGIADTLTAKGPQSVLAMTRHQATCLRRWALLAETVQQGRPAETRPGIRGEAGDRESFIGAMNDLAQRVASTLIASLAPLPFKHLLDVGGASGTWTIAWLRTQPAARATLFDLPTVLPLAEARLNAAGMRERVTLAGGDYLRDPLPGGADLAWVSAVLHQNSRDQNRTLLAQVHAALVPGGRIAVRDVVMEPSRTAPLLGALFAVNMLVSTEGGYTFTLDELRADLETAGFVEVAQALPDPGMNTVIIARKPDAR